MNRNNSKENGSFYKLTVLDVVVIVLILSLSTVIIVRTKVSRYFQSSEASAASIYHDGVLFIHLELDKDQELSLVEGNMLVEVNDGRIRVKKSNCPRQICVNAGWIKYPGEALVCVPYKTLIEIDSAESPVVDAVVY